MAKLSARMQQLLAKSKEKKSSFSIDPIFIDTGGDSFEKISVHVLPLNDAEAAHGKAHMLGILVEELYYAKDEGDTKFTIDPSTHGYKSAIGRYFAKQYKASRGNDKAEKAFKTLSDIVRQSRKYYVKVVPTRGAFKNQVKILRMGMKAYEAMQSWCEENEIDITHPTEGRLIRYKKIGSGFTTKYTATPLEGTSPLADDEKTLKKIVKAGDALSMLDYIPATDWTIYGEMYEALSGEDELPNGFGPSEGEDAGEAKTVKKSSAKKEAVADDDDDASDDDDDDATDDEEKKPATPTKKPAGKSPTVKDDDDDASDDDDDSSDDDDDEDETDKPAKVAKKSAPKKADDDDDDDDADDDDDDSSDDDDGEDEKPAKTAAAKKGGSKPSKDDDDDSGDDDEDDADGADAEDEVPAQTPKFKKGDAVVFTANGKSLNGEVTFVMPIEAGKPIMYKVKGEDEIVYKSKEASLKKPAKKK